MAVNNITIRKFGVKTTYKMEDSWSKPKNSQTPQVKRISRVDGGRAAMILLADGQFIFLEDEQSIWDLLTALAMYALAIDQESRGTPGFSLSRDFTATTGEVVS